MKDEPNPIPFSLHTRREFLGITTGGLSFSAASQLSATPPGGIGETDHFYYRLAPADGPYIHNQRDNKAFGFRDGKLFLSEDNAKTWPHSAEFADADNILFSSILENGNIVFATERRLFLGADNLAHLRELTAIDREGKPYRPHPLRDGEIPGWYFYSFDGIHTFRVEGREMLIWGNCANIWTGPAPVNIYYSTDGGETVKIAYSFGRNPAFQHEDADPAHWLGDPENPVVCRHVHSVTYNPAENAFYAATGDLYRNIGVGLECHWLRGTYDAAADTWEWKVVVSSDANSRFKSGGLNFVDGQAYWVADANGPKAPHDTYDRGIFRCAPEDIADKSRHTRLYDSKYELAVMTIHEDVIVAPEYGGANPCDCGILFSPDLGKTWGVYDLKEFGDRSGVRVHQPNSDGWFRLCLHKKWIGRGEVLFLKPK